MEKTIKIINQMKSEGLFSSYAIGGGIAALFYYVTRVLRPEYLVAIMLQSFRPKDKDRLIKFLEQADLSQELLDSILMKHDLKESYENFKGQYYGRSF